MKAVLLVRQKGRDIDLNQIAFLIFVSPQKSWFVGVRVPNETRLTCPALRQIGHVPNPFLFRGGER
jgi:hypothetical protein